MGILQSNNLKIVIGTFILYITRMSVWEKVVGEGKQAEFPLKLSFVWLEIEMKLLKYLVKYVQLAVLQSIVFENAEALWSRKLKPRDNSSWLNCLSHFLLINLCRILNAKFLINVFKFQYSVPLRRPCQENQGIVYLY